MLRRRMKTSPSAADLTKVLKASLTKWIELEKQDEPPLLRQTLIKNFIDDVGLAAKSILEDAESNARSRVKKEVDESDDGEPERKCICIDDGRADEPCVFSATMIGLINQKTSPPTATNLI